MAESDIKETEQLDLLRSLPLDDPEDKVDALWRQLMVFKTFAEGDLSESKSRRAQAEAAREAAERETADATRRLCETLKAEADKKLEEVERLKTEAQRTLTEAETERTRAKETKKESERARERILGEAKQKAQEILDQARLAAQQECTDLRRQALREIRTILERIETVRTATDEELESQRIFANIARLRANSPFSTAAPDYSNGDNSNADAGPEVSEAVHARVVGDDLAQRDGTRQDNASPMEQPPSAQSNKAQEPDKASTGSKGKEKKAAAES